MTHIQKKDRPQAVFLITEAWQKEEESAVLPGSQPGKPA
jgi:hypothetical protein